MCKLRPQLVILPWLTFQASAQPGGVGAPGVYTDPEFSVRDCYRPPRHVQNSSPVIRTDYVMKGTTIWRTIDLNAPHNDHLHAAAKDCRQVSLIEIIKYGLIGRGLRAFSIDHFDTAMTHQLTENEIRAALFLADSVETTVFDAAGNATESFTVRRGYVMAGDVLYYLLKEDWFMSTRSGRLEKQVVAFAPLVRNLQTGKLTPLFWLYYPEWREFLAGFQARNPASEEPVTFREVFERSLFVSRIGKQTNLYDRSLKSVHHGQDMILESEYIKERVRLSESDLFQH